MGLRGEEAAGSETKRGKQRNSHSNKDGELLKAGWIEVLRSGRNALREPAGEKDATAK
jgi:hypothetical protein